MALEGGVVANLYHEWPWLQLAKFQLQHKGQDASSASTASPATTPSIHEPISGAADVSDGPHHLLHHHHHHLPVLQQPDLGSPPAAQSLDDALLVLYK